MKKKLLVAILAFSIIGCSSDGPKEVGQISTTGTMKVSVLQKTNNPTSKDVKRNTLPVEIGGIIIIGVNNSIKQEFPFNIVENGTVGAEDDFIIRNLTTGSTTLSAFTKFKEYDDSWTTGSIVAIEDETLNSISNRLSQIMPRIRYMSKNPVVKNVIAGENDPVQFELTPINGRAITLIQFSEELKDQGYYAKIRIDKTQNSIPYKGLNQDETLNSDKILSVYTCNSTARVNQQEYNYIWPWTTATGNGDRFTVEVYDDKNDMVKTTIVDIDYINGTSVNTILTITSDGMLDKSSTQATFIVNEIINLPFINISK